MQMDTDHQAVSFPRFPTGLPFKAAGSESTTPPHFLESSTSYSVARTGSAARRRCDSSAAGMVREGEAVLRAENT